ncbi:MAG: right-handed parallel beta-helix repeat-containing protein [Anaerolineales bacterium]|nr:right-handed parallel beta-helix repeat-containing protein [Anaerolineales bacterium]
MKKVLILTALGIGLGLAWLLIGFNQRALANPGDVLVDRSTGIDQANCGNGINPPCYSIAYAMQNVAVAGDRVLVANGTYTETFYMQPGIAVVSVSGPTQTIIDGEGVRGPMVMANSALVTNTARLEGFTVTDSNNTGMSISRASPIISDCIIYDNQGNYGGGMAISHIESHVLINNSQIISNTANGDGGGIWIVDDASLTLLHSTVTTNTAGLWGGGVVANVAGSLNISDTLFQSNHANHGGGVFANNCDISLLDSEFYSNTSNSSGAAVYLYIYTGTVARNTIQNNTAQGSGGGVLISGASTLTLSHNEIIENTADDDGGGISIEGGQSLFINYNHIADNTGDGVYIAAGEGTLENNYIEHNTLRESEGQLKIVVASTFTVTNNTIAGNGNQTGVRIENGTEASLTNNIIEGNADGVRAISPVTVTLTNNDVWNNSNHNYDGISAGTTDISCDPDFVDAANGNYHLDICSCAVDTGTNSGAPTDDYDGDTRPVDGDGDSTGTVDIGADERLTVTAPLPLAGFTVQTSGLQADFTNTSSYAATYSWNFGDSLGSSTAVNPTYSYAAFGDYTVTLTTTCSFGCIDTYQDLVAITPAWIYLPIIILSVP